jgi:hypothetical protein
MKHGLLVLGALALLLASPAVRAGTPSPEVETALRARLLDFGVALGNEGLKGRDGFWAGRLQARAPQRLAVNLFAGNQYWFCAALSDPETVAALTVYDPQGRAVTAFGHTEAGLLATGVTAPETGRYVVELKASAGPSAHFVLLYLFR